MKSLVRYIALRLGSLMAADASPKVVFYHDIGKKYTEMGTPAEIFFAHMGCMRQGDVVCFDDGFKGLWDEREKLKVVSCKFRVIVFLAVALVGKSGYLTWDEIRELQDKYGIEFQCHTWSHQTLAGPWNNDVEPPIKGRTEDWFRHELIDSKMELERQLRVPVAAVCFPVGYFNDDILRRCKEAGYTQVYASYPGNITDEYVQSRCLVQNMSVNEFKCVLKGGMNCFKSHYLKRHKVDW